MLLKVLTTAFVIMGFGLLIVLLFVMINKPSGENESELVIYGTRILVYFGVSCLSWIAAAFCAVLLMRRTRNELVESQKENINSLIEGTLRDHERKE